MIAIINYGIGNVKSVIKAFQLYSDNIQFTDNPDIIRKSDGIVLPGVSAFGAAVEGLKKKKLIDTLKEDIQKNKKPFLGICIGIQLLFETSEETPNIEGLKIFDGKIKKFSENLTVPHIGWNQINIKKKNNPLLKGIKDNEYFYFVHSYYADPIDKNIIATTTEYEIDYTSSLWKDNIFAVQFHPEKSQEEGLKIIKNFVEICGRFKD